MTYLIKFHDVDDEVMRELTFDTLENAQFVARLLDRHPDFVYSHISEIIPINKINQNPVEKVDLDSMVLASQVMLGNYYGEIELHRFHDNYFITLNNWDNDNGRMVTKEFADAFIREFGSVE